MEKKATNLSGGARWRVCLESQLQVYRSEHFTDFTTLAINGRRPMLADGHIPLHNLTLSGARTRHLTSFLKLCDGYFCSDLGISSDGFSS